MSLGLALTGLLGLHLCFMTTRKILLTPTGMAIPASPLSQGKTIIPFRSISRLSMQTVQSSRVLRIEHAGGKTNVAQRFFESKDRFEEFLTRLESAAGSERPS